MHTIDNQKKTVLFSSNWKFYLLLFTFLLGTTSLQANDRPSITNERSRETFRDLQEAIELAFPGDTLRISGTVRGNFVISKNLVLNGHKATLDGNKTGPVLIIATPEGSLESVFVILNDLKIQNGFALALGGGGILNIDASVVVNNSEIENNQALLDAGGGIANVTILMPAFMAIEGSEISQNTARFGGGIANTGGFLEVTNSKITANLAEEAGGGIFSFFGNNAIRGTKISSNAAVLQGGGIENIADSETLLNDVELLNNHAGQGGGIFSGSEFFGGSSIAVFNSNLHGNNSLTTGGGIHNDSGSEAVFNFSKINRNGAAVGGGIFTNPAGALTLINDTEIKKNVPDNIVGPILFLN